MKNSRVKKQTSKKNQPPLLSIVICPIPNTHTHTEKADAAPESRELKQEFVPTVPVHSSPSPQDVSSLRGTFS